MTQQQAKVLSNQSIAKDYFKLVFTWDSKFEPKPGQFLTIRPQGKALLRRPFAFSSSNSIIYKTVGPGSIEFSKLKEGDQVDILAPLGNSFDLHYSQNPIIIAGGIGLGPMLFTAEAMAKQNLKPLLIIGARDKSFIPTLDINPNINVTICTDDGSMGFKGNVTNYLETLDQDYLKSSSILACGPHIMLKSCHNFSIENNIPCQVSLEEMMACAVGACYGCVVETTHTSKYKRVCKDGPVFNSREIIWT